MCFLESILNRNIKGIIFALFFSEFCVLPQPGSLQLPSKAVSFILW